MAKVIYNFDKLADADHAYGKMVEDIERTNSFGIDLKTPGRVGISLEGREIGHILWPDTPGKAPYIELESGTSMHKTALESIVKIAVEAHGGRKSDQIEGP